MALVKLLDRSEPRTHHANKSRWLNRRCDSPVPRSPLATHVALAGLGSWRSHCHPIAPLPATGHVSAIAWLRTPRAMRSRCDPRSCHKPPAG